MSVLLFDLYDVLSAGGCRTNDGHLIALAFDSVLTVGYLFHLRMEEKETNEHIFHCFADCQLKLLLGLPSLV